MPLVVLLDDWQRSALGSADWERLRGRARVRAIARPLPDADAVVSALRHATVVVAMRERTPFTAGLLARLPELRLLVTTGARNDAIDFPAAAAQGIVVSATQSAPVDAAELTWALILGALRAIPAQSARLRRGRWTGPLGRSLSGRTLGVVGLGRLGGHVARVGLAFGMDVVAWSANLTDARCAEVGVRRAPALASLLETSDVVTIHLRLSDRTRGLIGEAALRRMRPDATLVNTSRGAIVDEAALIRACREGWIAGAALDVFDEEPLPPDHPFRRLPNVLATPHLGYVADRSWTNWYAEALEAVEAWLDGAPIRTLTAGD
ncbi:MAG: D-2-hydroxyacid dehydrogenase family protein [Chloroflexi bacterium]|nr:D-2-hydroxyacid dehydrogenase family protein [Chloroflexota bacterium]